MFVTKRSGFAMILAIFVVVLVALAGVMIMSGSAIGGKSISDNYVKAQAELLAASATEFATMQAQGQQCLTNLNIAVNDPGGNNVYNVAVTMQYSFRNAAPVACTPADILAQNTGKMSMIFVNTVVTSAPAIGGEPIRIQKTSWQQL